MKGAVLLLMLLVIFSFAEVEGLWVSGCRNLVFCRQALLLSYTCHACVMKVSDFTGCCCCCCCCCCVSGL
jgi:hypothetical protein